MSPIAQIIVLSFATAAISITMTKTHFAVMFQDWLSSRSTTLALLFSCSYCMAHWIAAALVFIYRPFLAQSPWPCDIAVGIFCVIGMAALIMNIIMVLSSWSKRLKG